MIFFLVFPIVLATIIAFFAWDDDEVFLGIILGLMVGGFLAFLTNIGIATPEHTVHVKHVQALHVLTDGNYIDGGYVNGRYTYTYAVSEPDGSYAIEQRPAGKTEVHILENAPPKLTCIQTRKVSDVQSKRLTVVSENYAEGTTCIFTAPADAIDSNRIK